MLVKINRLVFIPIHMYIVIAISMLYNVYMRLHLKKSRLNNMSGMSPTVLCGAM